MLMGAYAAIAIAVAINVTTVKVDSVGVIDDGVGIDCTMKMIITNCAGAGMIWQVFGW